MPDPSSASPEIALITLAATDVAAMVAFYNAVFGANLEAFEAYNTTLYQGTLAGVPFMICPNERLGIQARKNRFKFDFFVNDVERAVKVALDAGGDYYGKKSISTWDGIQMASLSDPDGNTLVLRQRPGSKKQRR